MRLHPRPQVPTEIPGLRGCCIDLGQNCCYWHQTETAQPPTFRWIHAVGSVQTAGGGGGRVAGNSSAPLLHALIWTSLYTVTLRGKYHRGSHPEVLLVKVQRQAQPPAHGFRVLVLVES